MIGSDEALDGPNLRPLTFKLVGESAMACRSLRSWLLRPCKQGTHCTQRHIPPASTKRGPLKSGQECRVNLPKAARRGTKLQQLSVHCSTAIQASSRAVFQHFRHLQHLQRCQLALNHRSPCLPPQDATNLGRASRVRTLWSSQSLSRKCKHPEANLQWLVWTPQAPHQRVQSRSKP